MRIQYGYWWYRRSGEAVTPTDPRHVKVVLLFELESPFVKLPYSPLTRLKTSDPFLPEPDALRRLSFRAGGDLGLIGRYCESLPGSRPGMNATRSLDVPPFSVYFTQTSLTIDPERGKVTCRNSPPPPPFTNYTLMQDRTVSPLENPPHPPTHPQPHVIPL